MTPELPPRNWVVVDENTTRLANDEEYAEYLSIVIAREGLVIVDAPIELPTELPADLYNTDTE
jgi:hypothetical protein